jgi:hypothetical protein
MGNSLSSIHLRRAVRVKLKIERLERRLGKLLGGGGVRSEIASTPRNMSAEGKARIAAAQHKRWAAWRKTRAK